MKLRMSLADDRGSILPLVLLYGILALALVLIVTAATSLYLEKKRLFTLADGAALVGAESFSLTEVTLGPDGPRPLLHHGEVHTAVSSYLGGNPIGDFESLQLEEATTLDGLSATVTVSSVWSPPVVTVFVPEGLRIEATATARSVFG